MRGSGSATQRPFARRPRGDAPRPFARRLPRSTTPIEVVLRRQNWDSLVPHITAAGADPERALAAIKRYSELLLQWNRTVSNLIGRGDEERLVERHLLESLAPAAWLKEYGAERWIDFGSGAGLPAIPLALVGVGARWTLVESRRPKVLFMRKALSELELPHFEIFHGRLEEFVQEPERKDAFDGFTSRATLTAGPTLSLATQVIAPNGNAFLWKGSKLETELASTPEWAESWRKDRLESIGVTQARLVIFKRVN